MNHKGSLLITTLWAMSLFSIMTASLIFGASQHVLMMKREIQNFQDKADMESVFGEICSKINTDLYPHEDSAEDAWYGETALSKPFAQRVTARVEDEESKVNLNDVSERFLKEFFKAFENQGVSIKGEAKDYIKNILKLRSEKRIQSMEELLLTDSFENEDYEILLPYFTVYPDLSLVNINTAKPLVLNALIESIPGDHAAKLLLIGRLTESCGQAELSGQCYFLSRELVPDVFTQKLHLPQTTFMDILVQEFLSKVTADSETFHLVMKTKTQKEADLVFRYRSGQLRPEVLSWHEI